MIRIRQLPNGKYLAEDPMKRRHIQRIGISKSNAIAWLKAAHKNAYKAAKIKYEEEERIRKGLEWLKKLSE
jgi:hypothetical protein